MTTPASPVDRLATATLQWLKDTTSMGVFSTDKNLVIQTWNKWMSERSGIPSEAACGIELLNLFPALRDRGLEPYYLAALRGHVRLLAQRFHHYLLPMAGPVAGRPMDQSATISPLWVDGAVEGTITVIDDVSRRVLQEETLRQQIQELEQVRRELDRSGHELQKSLNYERELVQTFARSFLQDSPTDSYLDVACMYHPALTNDHVGGDFYDFIQLDDDRLAIVMGDVCGKGVKAAVYTAMAKYTLRAYAEQDPRPGPLMRRVNDSLYRQVSDAGMFISMFYLYVDRTSTTIHYVNCGHPAPVLTTADGSVTFLHSNAPVLGAFTGIDFPDATAAFSAGSVLALFTDGITEARGDLMSSEESGVSDVVRDSCLESAALVCERIYEFAQRESKGHLRDDVAIVVVRHP